MNNDSSVDMREGTGRSQPEASGAEGAPAVRLTLDGRRLKELVRAAYLWLRQQEERVNSYNVYPVPDGDTGTNMMHTMRAAWEAIANLDEPSIGVVARHVSNGALRGSRGNSGIILSQLWRGFARSLDGKAIGDAQDIVAALKEAARTAYAGVGSPVEGTMLTVAREVAEAVEHAAQHTHDLRRLLQVAREAAYDSVQRTPNLLKILREAGVVDSGGFGLYVIYDGMWRLINDLPVSEEPSAASRPAISAQAQLQREEGWGYDVQYLLYARPGRPLDVDKIRADIEAMGECPLVMGDATMVKVHVHVPDPGVPISYGAALGSLRDVVIEDMQAQSEAFVLQPIGESSAPSEAALPEVEVAMIAVASGVGLVRIFQELGARVVEGGQTMNPSVEDLLNAIEQARARSVLLLPNNSNIVMTAEQAARLSSVPAWVVPTRTVPQGVGAAIAFRPDLDAQTNLAIMQQAAAAIVTAEVTTSTRDVTLDGVPVQAGQVIGLVNDRLKAAGDKLTAVLLQTLEAAGADHHELISIYYGNGLSAAEVEATVAQVRQRFPAQQVDVIAGGQPHYYFIVGIE